MSFFDSFVNRVMNSAKLGKLDKSDQGKLKRMFDNAKKRNVILAKGILSALKAGKSNQGDISRFAGLLEDANERIANGKMPFSPSEEKELRTIFQKAGISEKTVRWFSLQMDEFLGYEIDEAVKGKKTLEALPSKKSVKVDFEQKKQKLGA